MMSFINLWGLWTETIIKTNNLTKKYKDVVAVNNLNLELYQGELFSLLGVNGAGKTTTIKILTTLSNPTSGDATIYGYSINSNASKIKELIDLSMQETAVTRKLTVEENIEFYAKLTGQSKNEISETKKYIYKSFSLEKVKNKQHQNYLLGGKESYLLHSLLFQNQRYYF